MERDHRRDHFTASYATPLNHVQIQNDRTTFFRRVFLFEKKKISFDSAQRAAFIDALLLRVPFRMMGNVANVAPFNKLKRENGEKNELEIVNIFDFSEAIYLVFYFLVHQLQWRDDDDDDDEEEEEGNTKCSRERSLTPHPTTSRTVATMKQMRQFRTT